MLSAEGAVGLDLHFVTHIFFLEEPMDRSLEAQVIARAWRMGCRHTVQVQKLVMAGTVDEMLWRVNTGQDAAFLRETAPLEEEEEEEEEEDGAEDGAGDTAIKVAATAPRRPPARSSARSSAPQSHDLPLDLVKTRYLLKSVPLLQASSAGVQPDTETIS
jgi:hypothetical protein